MTSGGKLRGEHRVVQSAPRFIKFFSPHRKDFFNKNLLKCIYYVGQNMKKKSQLSFSYVGTVLCKVNGKHQVVYTTQRFIRIYFPSERIFQ